MSRVTFSFYALHDIIYSHAFATQIFSNAVFCFRLQSKTSPTLQHAPPPPLNSSFRPSLPRVHLGEILQEAYQLDTPPPPSNSAPLVNQSGESDNPKSGITPSDGGDILTPPLSSPHLEQDEKTTTPNERHLSSIVKTQAQLVSSAKREVRLFMRV